MNRFDAEAGLEVMLYPQFVRHFAMRERVNDIVNFKVFGFGDIELPRNSLFHYLPNIPGEIGPGNDAAFINTYPGRIDMHFDWEYDKELEKTGIRIKPTQKNQVEVGYFKSHFKYFRARQLEIFLGKEQELIVNNLAPAFLNVVYVRRTVFTPFVKHYNTMCTLIGSINRVAEISTRHQFFELKLPNTFPSYQELKQAFIHYEKFFDENGEIVRYKKEALKLFQANKAYWLLDLYSALLGHQYSKFSLFSKLTDKAKENTSFIFSYNGKCVICNIQTLINLISSSDKPEDTQTPSIRVNYFKRFYLNLISLVTNVDYSAVIDGEENERKGETVPETSVSVGGGDNPDRLADGVGNSEGSGNGLVREEGSPGSKSTDQNAVAQTSVVPDVTEQMTSNDNAVETSWGSDISDEVFEQLTVEDSQVVASQAKIDYTPATTIDRILDQRAKEGKLTNKEKEYFQRVANSYKSIEIGNRTVAEIIDIKPTDMVIKKPKIAKDSETIVDKTVLQSRAFEITKGYVENLHHRNLIEMMAYTQNAGVCITDIQVQPITTARSKYDVWTMKIQPVNGNASTRSFSIPRVEKDGTFTINGVKSYMQIQRMEKPVRKISPISVQLTSYYDKPRIIIERSKRVVDDYPRWLRLRIINAAKLDKSIKVVLGSYSSHEKGMCYYYSILASRFKELEVQGHHFVFDTHSVIGDDPVGKELCNEESWVVGKTKNGYLTIDNTGMVMVNNQDPIGYIESLFNIDLKKAPLPVATINIGGYKFPVVIVLSYWMGFENLLKALNVEYRTEEPNKRIELEKDEYVIPFADEKLVFNRRDELTTLIISGLLKIKTISDYSRSYLDDPNIWYSLMDDPKVKPSQFREMSQIYDMYIDPITKRLLEKDGYPVIMDQLVIAALKLLLTQYAPAETEITEQRFVGYERFSGHLYREMCRAARQFRNKPTGGKRTFDLNPDAIMMKIITDSSVQAVEEVNPIHQLKQQEEVTYGGSLGRAEQAMVRRTRGMRPNYTGIISEAGKDSGKVGFVSYLTVDPKFVDYYGNVDVNEETTKSGFGSVTLNTLYGGTRDDTKRAVFSSVQRSQLMATVNYVANPIRTSYDTIIAQRTSEIYSSVAKKNGKVTSIEDGVGFTVQYEDGSEDQFPIGLYYGKGAGEYHKHDKITDMVVGETFEAGDILAWDDLYFERDPFNKGKVVVKLGVMARIGLFEDQFSFEDSIGITKPFAVKTSIPFVKPKTFDIHDDQVLKVYKKVGDVVGYDDVLYDIIEPTADFGDNDAFAGFDRYGIKQVKPGMNGQIKMIEVFYNGDIEDFSPECQKFIKEHNKFFAKKAKYVPGSAVNGDIGGNTSITKVEIYPGTIRVNVYIEEILESTTADKLVIGNQMKGTIGYIYPESLYTTDGRRVDAIFSTCSLLRRMVLNVRDKLGLNELNNVYTNRLIEKIEGTTTWEL